MRGWSRSPLASFGRRDRVLLPFVGSEVAGDRGSGLCELCDETGLGLLGERIDGQGDTQDKGNADAGAEDRCRDSGKPGDDPSDGDRVARVAHILEEGVEL